MEPESPQLQPQTQPQPAPIPPANNLPNESSQPPQNPYPGPAAVVTPQNSGPAPNQQTGMFNGRLNRIGYLLSFVYIVIYFLIPVVLVTAFRDQAFANILASLMGIIGIALVIPVGISIAARRWHDLNQSGWMMLLALIPFAGLILLIVYLFVPGTKGPNKYGAPDTRPASFKKVLFGK